MFFIFSRCSIVYGWDSVDLELFDLVEEIKDNFYDILGLKQVSMTESFSSDKFLTIAGYLKLNDLLTVGSTYGCIYRKKNILTGFQWIISSLV